MFAASKTDGSAVAPDAQFNYVTMLLHGDGTNGAQNNTFLDSSTNAFSITRNGNTTQGSFSPYGSNWSNYFNGSSDYLGLGTSTNLALGAGDFTIEVWLSVTAYNASTSNIFEWRSAGGTPSNIPTLYLSASGVPTFYASVGSGALITGSSAVALNTWTHLAIVRSGSTVTMYLNGTSVGSATNSANLGTQSFYINDPQGTYRHNGYFSNVRMVKGTAVYTGSFTPSTTPLTAITNTQLLTCQSNRFVDNSTNAFTVTVNGTPSVQRFNPFGTSTAYSTSVIGGSGYFDGSGDNLIAVSANTANAMGTGDWTAEAWIYLTVGGGTPFVFDTLPSGSGSATGLRMRLSASNQLQLWQYGSAVLTSSATVTVNAWTHVALVKSSGTTTAYVNGTASNTYSDSGNYICGTNRPMIGSDGFNNGSENSFTGYISNLRLVKGTAVYTSSFTPNTAPLSAITNTSLLTNFTNGAIFDNAMMNDLETVGNAQISTSVVKYGTGSLYFDGSAYLFEPSNQSNTLGTGNFTIEAWIYPIGSNGTICEKGYGLANGFLFWYQSGQIRIRTYNGSSTQTNIFASSAITYDTWQHVAAVRSSGTITLYVNGTSVASGADTDNLSSTDNFQIGAYDGYTLPMQGYMDEFRITKGYARYTATFTPPTVALSDTGPY